MADDASTENILVAEEVEEAAEGEDLHEEAEAEANGAAEGAAEESTIEDPELEAIKQRVKEMEEEAEKLKEMQNQVEKQIMSPSAGTPSGAALPSWEEKQDADLRSVYVGNVDYGATAEELESHFHGCGAVHRVTILCDKFTGHPKGFAYIEFADKDAVEAAVALDDSLFRGRQIKVSAKRTNRPGVSSTNRGGRTRGRRPYRHFYQPYYPPRFRGRYRRRASSWHAY